MREEFRSIDTSDRAVRHFGYLMGVIALVVGVWMTWKAGWMPANTALGIVGAGVAIALAGRLLPALLRPVFKLWMMLAVVLGFIMTRVILTIVYFGIVTPIGVVMRLARRDPLAKRPDRDVDSYWIPVDRDAETREEVAARLRRYY